VPTLINVLESDLKLLSHHHNPVVVFGYLHEKIPGVDTVKSDYGGGAIQMMSHLLELGHRRIGFIFGVVKKTLGDERLLAYQMMLNKAGLPVDETLIIRTGTTYQDGYLAALELINRSPRPTAILALNDVLAIGAMHAIYEKGFRIPEDISVAGFDDIDVSPYHNPSLTTLNVNAEELGRTSIRLIIQRLSNTGIEPQNILVPPKVIIRKSTGPVPEEQE
jgi:DNA-binding LacI/PurR family transcriptional regulator